MREWTREEKYRYLKDPQELKELYDRISKSQYRQTFHNQAVTGLMNDPVVPLGRRSRAQALVPHHFEGSGNLEESGRLSFARPRGRL